MLAFFTKPSSFAVYAQLFWLASAKPLADGISSIHTPVNDTYIDRNQVWSKRAGPPVSGAAIALQFLAPEESIGALYWMQLTVGPNGATSTYTVLPDTGSGLLWLGAGEIGYPLPGSMPTGQTGMASYPAANIFIEGPEFAEFVSLASIVGDTGHQLQSANVRQSVIGIDPDESDVIGFLDTNSNANGIMGLAPKISTKGDFQPNTNQVVDNVVGTLFTGNALALNQFSFYMTPSRSATASRLILGGPLQGPPVWTRNPTSVNIPLNGIYWSLGITVTYGANACPILPVPPVQPPSQSQGFVDSGFPVISFSAAAMNRYIACTQGLIQEDTNTDNFFITRANFPRLQSLFFNIGGQSFEFTPDAQVLPNTLPGQPTFDMSIQSRALPSANDFILGVPFHQRFYIIHDLSNVNQPRLLVAPTAFTPSVSNSNF